MSTTRTIKAVAGPLSAALVSKGITTCDELLRWVKSLPYGRNTSREQYQLVLTEHKGTCSTKHAFVKAVALENDWRDVDLYIGFFFMDSFLFPKLKEIFDPLKIEGIPEAHTFLVIDGEYTDVTGLSSPINENEIVDEIEIQPEGIGDLKVSIHKGFIEDWAEEEKINLPLDQLWIIREACIVALSKD